MTKLVLFDCDGVLINTEELGYHILNDMLAREGISYTREAYVEMLSGITLENFYDYLRKTHPDLPENFERDLQARILASQEADMKVIEGVRALLQKLKDNNIPFAVCSNSGAESLLRKLKKVGLYDDFVPHIYSKDHVDNPKPAPDIYEHAAQIRRIKPEDCIVVEDTMTGVRAGVAAGMNVIGFVGESHRDDSEAEMLTSAGAAMIALSPAQIWEHIADFAGLTPPSPFNGGDLSR